jgi:hypothetical protein
MAKKKRKKHISEKYSFKGVLSRNDPKTYRTDCRGKLKGTFIYDNVFNIEQGIRLRDAETGFKSPDPLAKRIKSYTFDHKKKGVVNFTTGGRPYHNQAHHVVPVEVFYEDHWTTPHLHIVKSAKAEPDDDDAPGYNINNADNIIILPQCHTKTHIMRYHVLPDHSLGHGAYNDRVVEECRPLFDMADKALNEPDCDKKDDIRKQIYDQLKQIESKNFGFLKDLGMNPLS